MRAIEHLSRHIIDRGRVRNSQVIPAEFFEDLARNPQRETLNENSNLSGNHLQPGAGYRSYVFIPPIDSSGNVTFIAGGGYGQHCYIDPVRPNVIVKLSSEMDFDISVHRDLSAIRSLSEKLPEIVQ